YLVRSDLFSSLESPSARLMQRNLHEFQKTDIHEMIVRGSGRQKKLQQRNRLDPRKSQWVDAAAPDRRNDLYGNWLDQVDRLTVQTYLPIGKAPGSDIKEAHPAPVPVLTLSYITENANDLGTLDLVRVDTQPARFYAKSEATRSWVTVASSVAVQVSEDLPQ